MPLASRFPWSRPKRYAVIDIGTNTCLLLIGEVFASARKYRIARDVAEITQLGKGFYATNCLRDDAIDRTLHTISGFLDACREKEIDAADIVVTGTSVLRDAQNGDDFVRALESRHPVNIEIIPGEEEARLSYLAVRRDRSLLSDANSTCIVTDIGGGSTELIVGDDRIRRMASLNLGSVRLTEVFFGHDPPELDEIEALRAHVSQVFQHAAPPSSPAALVGVGGTITTLASIASPRDVAPLSMHGFRLTRETVGNQIDLFASMPTDERERIPGLDPKRAGVILAGALITEYVLSYFEQGEMDVSVRGLRYGVFFDRFLDHEDEWDEVAES